jgi:hypothetical protein
MTPFESFGWKAGDGARSGVVTTLSGAWMKFSNAMIIGLVFSALALVALMVGLIASPRLLDAAVFSIAFGVLGVAAFAADIALALHRRQ